MKNKDILILALVIFGILSIILLVGYGPNLKFSPAIEKYNFNELPDSFDVTLGNEFRIDIDILEQGNYVFSEDTDLFDIEKETGIISFIPEEPGEYKVNLIALENVDNFHIKLITFRVVGPWKNL